MAWCMTVCLVDSQLCVSVLPVRCRSFLWINTEFSSYRTNPKRALEECQFDHASKDEAMESRPTSPKRLAIITVLLGFHT